MMIEDQEPVDKKPWEMTWEEFICPHYVGDMFSVDGRNDMDWEWIWEDEEGFVSGLLLPVWTSECGDYSIREFECDSEQGLHLVLVHKGQNVAGFYFNCINWVAPEHRGRGFGVQLVIQATEMLGRSPTANEEVLGFTEAGIAVMQKAHRIIVERAFAAGDKVPGQVLECYDLSPRENAETDSPKP